MSSAPAPPAATPVPSSGTARYRLPVRIRSQDGRTGGFGAVAYARPAFRRRLGKAALTFLMGLVVGVLVLPVPLIHLFGVIFFLAMSVLAIRRLATRAVLDSAEGRCPSCQAEGPLFVGLGGRRFAFPIRTSCPRCHVRLDLEPMAPRASGGSSLPS
jgi:hypothetical protein